MVLLKFLYFFLKTPAYKQGHEIQKVHGLTKIYYKSHSLSSHGRGHFSTSKSKISALNVGSVIASYKSPLTI